jgi:hypothetical protein
MMKDLVDKHELPKREYDRTVVGKAVHRFRLGSASPPPPSTGLRRLEPNPPPRASFSSREAIQEQGGNPLPELRCHRGEQQSTALPG